MDLRLALAHPERITAIVSQNGNAYEEGLSQGWNPSRSIGEPSTENRAKLREFLLSEATKSQYLYGVEVETLVAPDGYILDSVRLARPGNDEIQLHLFLRVRKQRCALSAPPGVCPHETAALACGPGQETIRCFWLLERRRPNAIILLPRCISTMQDILPWRHMHRKLPAPFASSSSASWQHGPTPRSRRSAFRQVGQDQSRTKNMWARDWSI